MDLELIAKHGCTQERLRQIFTAGTVGADTELSEAEKRDAEIRRRWEDRIRNRLNKGQIESLARAELYGAVDLAWDAPPINQESYPLILYAQGRLNQADCVRTLENLQCGSQYIQRDSSGKAAGIDLPRFYEVHCNLVRHFVTRRLAAQMNKYANLWPYFRYEPRVPTMAAKITADIESQRVEEMADAYDYRHHDEQVVRDMLLYGFSVDFVRSAWDCSWQWRIHPDAQSPHTVAEREGVDWINAHPTRLFYDSSEPLARINSDTGPSYIGYWDIVPYGSVHNNADYWNRNTLGYTDDFLNLFSSYPGYFSQYYCTVKVPQPTSQPWLKNDRIGSYSLYNSQDDDAACLIAVYFERVVPKDEGFGDYPFPVWVRFICGGAATAIVFAEYLPSAPAAYCGLNIKDDRRFQLSFAHELMPYQDQMTNLLSQLLQVCRMEQMKILAVNTDVLADETVIRRLREGLAGSDWHSRPHLLEYSGSKMAALGVEMREPLKLIQPQSNPQSIQILFQSMTTLIQLIERLEAMSANEVGQPIVRSEGGVTATEAQLINASTNSVYNYISDAVDNYRAAKKRIIHESLMVMGPDFYETTTLSRYPRSEIVKAGFEVVDLDEANSVFIVRGRRDLLRHSLIYSTRDGNERPINAESARTLVQLLPMLMQLMATGAIGGQGKLVEIINEIFRLLGAGVDLRLEASSEPGQPLPQPGQNEGQAAQQEVEAMRPTLEGMTRVLQQHTDEITSLKGQGQAAAPQFAGVA